MNDLKLYPYLKARIYPVLFVILACLFLLAKLSNTFLLIMYSIFVLGAFAYLIIKKKSLYIVASMLTITTLLSGGLLIVALISLNIGEFFKAWVIYYLIIQFLVLLVVNILFEIGLWIPSSRIPNQGIKLNLFFLISLVLSILCLATLAIIFSKGVITNFWTFLLVIPWLIATNPLFFISIGIIPLKNKPIILDKVFLVFSILYAISLIVLPYIFRFIVA